MHQATAAPAAHGGRGLVETTSVQAPLVSLGFTQVSRNQEGGRVKVGGEGFHIVQNRKTEFRRIYGVQTGHC